MATKLEIAMGLIIATFIISIIGVIVLNGMAEQHSLQIQNATDYGVRLCQDSMLVGITQAAIQGNGVIQLPLIDADGSIKAAKFVFGGFV